MTDHATDERWAEVKTAADAARLASELGEPVADDALRDTTLADSFAEHHAKQDADDEAEAERLEVTVEQLRAARQYGVEPQEYAKLSSVRTADEAQEAEAERLARDPDLRRLIERVRERMGA